MELRLLILAVLQINGGGLTPTAVVVEWLEWCADNPGRWELAAVLRGSRVPRREPYGWSFVGVRDLPTSQRVAYTALRRVYLEPKSRRRMPSSSTT